MSVQALSWAFKQHMQPARKIVLLAIANCANDEGENSFPSQASLSASASMSVRSVKRHVAWLEAKGFIRRIKRFRINGTRTSDCYAVAMNGLFEPVTNDNVIRCQFGT
jgi:Helix-turn-helix domain